MTAPPATLPIRPALRWALAAKAALLFGLALGFFGLCLATALSSLALLLRLLVLVVCAPLGALLAWAGRLGLADAVRGVAVRVQGAEALRSRRSGYSLRLPDGHFAEFALWNTAGPLVPGQRYTVTIGLRSRVLVAPPVPEEA